MNKLKTGLFIILLLIYASNFLQAQTTYFIRYNDQVDKSEIERKISSQKFLPDNSLLRLANTEYNVSHFAKGIAKEDDILGRIIKITFMDEPDENTILNVKNFDPSIEYIQKANFYKTDLIPNDSLVSEQWALEKIKAFEAWDITTGSDTVLLAIIDTGLEFFHPDLENKIFYNPGETGQDINGNDKKSNGTDDDGNGFIDDYMGWDFVDRVGVPFDTAAGDFHNWDNMPYDPKSGSLGFHGTFVGGIAGAEMNNISGIAGIAPNVKLLNIRSFDNGGSGEEDDAAAAILYAVLMGAKVVNMSFGDYTFSYVLRDVIRYAYSRNVVLVASAGNRNINTPHYPSGYSEVISVSGSTRDDFAAGFAWGSTVDFVAPGVSIMSTTVNSKYRSDGGTSASAPFAAAAAALILAVDNFTNEEVKQILKSTCDDIGQSGWDLRTGAGRLNLHRALSVLAPSVVKFNFPHMDYATSGNSIEIDATVLSPYFEKYSLLVGGGYNPDEWTTLIENGQNQFSGQKIFNLDISSYQDDVYCLRLLVYQNNGGTLEERINFHIMRAPPVVTEIGLGPIFYGDRSTISGEFLTNVPCIMRLYYRKYGESNFNFVTLDGFNTNNQFVKTLHYGFIPKEIVEPATFYEIYFEAENLAGLKTQVVDSLNNNSYFLIPTDKLPESVNHKLMPFSLSGNIVLFPEPVGFLSDKKNEVLSQPFIQGTTAAFLTYKMENNEFAANEGDTLINRFPLIYGDFNNDGLKNLITVNHTQIVLLEQTQAGSFAFNKKDSTDKLFFPLAVDDLAGDGNKYLITEPYNQNSYLLWKLNPDMSTVFQDTLYKTKSDNFGLIPTTRNLMIDTDKNGVKKIWFLDSYGDIRSLRVNQDLSFTKADSFKISATNLFGLTPPHNQDVFSIGDYNGDGNEDFAVLYQTNSVAPAFMLLILTFENNNVKLLSQKVFLDQSDEYSGGLVSPEFFQSLKFADIDNDGTDELILNMFPYSYIFKYSAQEDKIIFYTEGSNTQNVFVGDLNQNGIKEICFRINEEFRFFEFAYSGQTAVPSDISGYSISPENLKLSWHSSAQIFYIYKGTDINNLLLIDSVLQEEYTDINVSDSTTYYYAVSAYDQANPQPLSPLSKTIGIYSHSPAKPVSAVSANNSALIVTFSEKMKNVIENLKSFEVINSGFPNSVSPNTEYSYLVTFKNNLPPGEQRLIIKNIKDLYDSPVAEDTLLFSIIPVVQEENFFISSFELINPKLIKLIFNMAVDEISASLKDNYSFDPENYISGIDIDNSDKRIVYINLDGRRPVGAVGIEYRLRVSDVTSFSGIKINSGAGSYAVITSFADDLSNVFVYPNPVKTGAGERKLTFAGLPRKAKIIIFDLNGKQLQTIEENNGDGGAALLLGDENGNELSSGIYIYRVVRLDDQNNEVEEKLGKFAVIK